MYVAPNYEAWPNADTWPIITNNAITVVSVFKSGIDVLCLQPKWVKVSPWVEFFIPATGGIGPIPNRKACDWTLFAANVTFDVSGRMTPFDKRSNQLTHMIDPRSSCSRDNRHIIGENFQYMEYTEGYHQL